MQRMKGVAYATLSETKDSHEASEASQYQQSEGNSQRCPGLTKSSTCRCMWIHGLSCESCSVAHPLVTQVLKLQGSHAPSLVVPLNDSRSPSHALVAHPQALQLLIATLQGPESLAHMAGLALTLRQLPVRL